MQSKAGQGRQGRIKQGRGRQDRREGRGEAREERGEGERRRKRRGEGREEGKPALGGFLGPPGRKYVFFLHLVKIPRVKIFFSFFCWIKHRRGGDQAKTAAKTTRAPHKEKEEGGKPSD